MRRTPRLASVSLVSIAAVAIAPAAHAQVTFTPTGQIRRSPELSGVTFTPGARQEPSRSEPSRTEPSRSETPAPEPPRDNARARAETPCEQQAAQQRAAQAPTVIAANASPAPREPAANDARAAHVAIPERTHEALTRVIEAPRNEPAPQEDRGTACSLVNGIEELSLDESPSHRDAFQRALELSISSFGREVVALVTLGRVGAGREGMTFTQSRLVHFSAERNPTVSRAMGFEPGAVVALGPDNTVFVLSSARFDVRHQRAAEDLKLTVLDTRGTVRSAPRPIEATRGMSIDSAPVAWRGGVAVVLGEPTIVGADHAFGPVRERVFTFALDGSPRVAPWVLTEAQSPDAVGRFRVGLGRIAGGDALAAVFSDGRALQVRRFAGGTPSESPTRVFDGHAWAPEVSHDGASLIFREGGTDGRPVRLRVARWDGANVIDVGQGWEPLASVHFSRVLVAGALVPLEDGRRTTALFTEGSGQEPPRVLVAPHGAHARLDDAIDVALAPTDEGALLAWIESTDRTQADAPRRLAYARVRCR